MEHGKGKERRFIKTTAELRSDEGKEMPTVVGYAMRFGEMSDPYWSRAVGFYETIAPEAPIKALEDLNRDIRALRDHRSDLLLGRNNPSKNVSTLRYSIDSIGVKIEIDLPNTQQARDMVESMKRGDLDGMSFGFYVDEWEWTGTHEGLRVRTIRSFSSIDDFSVVTYPVYGGTTAEVRSISGIDFEPPTEPILKPYNSEHENLKQKFREKMLTHNRIVE